MAREWEGQSEMQCIARFNIIDAKDREGKERENYLVGDMQAGDMQGRPYIAPL